MSINGSKYIFISISKQIKSYASEKYIRIKVCLNSFISGYISEKNYEYYITFYIDIYLDIKEARIEVDSLTIKNSDNNKYKKTFIALDDNF